MRGGARGRGRLGKGRGSVRTRVRHRGLVCQPLVGPPPQLRNLELLRTNTPLELLVGVRGGVWGWGWGLGAKGWELGAGGVGLDLGLGLGFGLG